MPKQSNIDEQFKSGFEHFEVTPSGRVWDNISSELDRQNTPASGWKRLAIVASFLIGLAGAGVGIYYFPFEQLDRLPQAATTDHETKEEEPASAQQYGKSPQKQTAQPAPRSDDAERSEPTQTKTEDVGAQPEKLASRQASNITTSDRDDDRMDNGAGETPLSLGSEASEQPSAEPLTEEAKEAELMKSIFVRYLEHADRNINDSLVNVMYEKYVADNNQPDVKKLFEKKPLLPHGFYVGLTANVHHNAIVNENRYNDYGGAHLGHGFAIGYSAGLVAGYSFSDNISLQTGLLHTRAGHQHRDEVNGFNITQEVMLNYTRVPLLLKYTASKLGTNGTRPISNNILLGGYGGMLKSGFLSINGDEYLITDRFDGYDYGLMAGLEHERYFCRNFSFALGIRGVMGLQDIAPEDYGNNDPYLNTQVGVNATIRYTFSRSETVTSEISY